MPFNKIAGLGFDGVPAESELEEIESAFASTRRSGAGGSLIARRSDVLRLLTRRHYELVGFENVLGLDLRTWQPPAASGDAIDVRPARRPRPAHGSQL